MDLRLATLKQSLSICCTMFQCILFHSLRVLFSCEGVEKTCRTAHKTKQDYQSGFTTPRAHKKIASRMLGINLCSPNTHNIIVNLKSNIQIIRVV